MQSLRLTRFDPEPADEPTRWQVGYDAVLDDGREVHSVTTVYRSQLPAVDDAQIMAIADAAILPGLILQDRQLLPGLPELPEPTEDKPSKPEKPDKPTGHTHGTAKP